MPEINYKEFESFLDKAGKQPGGGFSAVYLIHGEELLYKKAHAALLDRLLPGETRNLNHEPVEGTNDNIADAVNRMNTYSLLAGTKVVSFQDARVFYARQDKGKMLEKVKSASGNREMKKAARYLLSLMAQLGITFEDLRTDEKGLGLLIDTPGDAEWLEKVVAHCTENDLAIPGDRDYAKLLQVAVEKGFPKGNHLIITTDMVDRRRGLFNSLKEHGVVVDCSVPKGNRRADKLVQENVLKERMNNILAASRKRMDPRAFALLFEMTGFDLRTFSGNMEKLVLYAGDRDTITPDDVTAILERTKEDPIYELTGAVSDRNLEKSLFYLQTLLASNSHPLQILAALTNHMRKVLLAKAYTESPQGRAWRPGMPFNPFKSSVIPAIKTYDAELMEKTDQWESMLASVETVGAGDAGEAGEAGQGDTSALKAKTKGKKPKTKKPRAKKKKAKKKNPSAGLRVAENPNNPYPVYLMLKKADGFTMAELLSIYTQLGEIDISLKRTGKDPAILLEALIIRICQRG